MAKMIDIKLKWLEDALSESTRKARRNLLAVGGLAIFLIKGELMPSKISALGISIESVQKETILTALLVLSAYYFIKFYLYAFVDGERQVHKMNKLLLGETTPKNNLELKQMSEEKYKGMAHQLGIRGFVLFFMKQSFDFFLPLIVGVFALVTIYNAF